MILMWLGSFVLMLFGLDESRNQIATLFSSAQQRLNKDLPGESRGRKVITTAGVVLCQASPQESLKTAMSLYCQGLAGQRESVLAMCLSTLGAWWVLLLSVLFLNLSGFFVLGLGIFGYLNLGLGKRAKIAFRLIFATGVFLVGSEAMLKNASILHSLLGQSDFAFFLADGRFGAFFALLAFSFFISLVFEIEFWSLILALALLFIKILSFNGALALIAGERIARISLLIWQARGSTLASQRLALRLAALSIFGVFVGLFIAGEFRLDSALMQGKTLQLQFALGTILLFQFLAQMIGGHFLAEQNLDPRNR